MLKNLLLAFAFSCCCLCAPAQRHHHVDPADLDFGTNLVTPDIPTKPAADIRLHMIDIKNALLKHNIIAEMDRNNEVVRVIIPCSDLFAPNQTVLKAKAAAKLRVFADLLKHPTMYKLIVAVYSDNTGEPEYCENLTMARANAVDDFLIDLAGGADINVVPYGMGAEDPITDNNSIENRDRNRRVEIFIVPEWQMIDTARAGKLRHS